MEATFLEKGPTTPPSQQPAQHPIQGNGQLPSLPGQDAPAGLLPAHRKHLQDAGISDDIIRKRGYESVGPDSPKLRKFSKPARVSGLLIPHCAKGKMRFQLKPDVPPVDKDGKPKKYFYESGSNRFIDTLHAPAEALADQSRPIAIVEGIKKGDSFASHPFGKKFCILIIDSCSGALSRQQIELLEPLVTMDLKGRLVYVCLDADIASNQNVWTAAAKLQERLLFRGAAVRFVMVPPGKTGKEGLDDFIAADGDVEDLFSKAQAALPPQPKSRGRPPKPRPKIDPTGCVFIPYEKSWDHVGFGEALKVLGLEVRLNIRSGNYEFRAACKDTIPGFSLEEWTQAYDHLEQAIRAVMRERVLVNVPGDGGPEYNRYKVPIGNMYREFRGAVSPEVDPFKDWLHSREKWDGTPRIDRVLCDGFGCDATELYMFISSRIFMWAVERTLRPGTKQDVMPILVGKQGIGKSTFLRDILPNPSFFTDTFSFSMKENHQIEATLGTVLVEVSELAGLRRQEANACKAYLSRQVDKYRPPYREQPELFPRRFIIVGTSNDDGSGVLPDDSTGSRRYVVVVCKNENEIDFGKIDQWWAEALHRVQAGEETQMPKDLYEDQATVNGGYAHPPTMMEEEFEEFLMSDASRRVSGQPISKILRMAFPDMGESSQAHSSLITPKKASNVLRRCDWIKRGRRNNVHLWWHPAASTSAT